MAIHWIVFFVSAAATVASMATGKLWLPLAFLAVAVFAGSLIWPGDTKRRR